MQSQPSISPAAQRRPRHALPIGIGRRAEGGIGLAQPRFTFGKAAKVRQAAHIGEDPVHRRRGQFGADVVHDQGADPRGLGARGHVHPDHAAQRGAKPRGVIDLEVI